MRTQSKTMQFIDYQCQSLGLDQKSLFERSKTLLSLYRHVVWAVKGRAIDLQQEIVGTYGMQLNTALLYLSDLAPTATRAGFETTVNQLFEAKWMIHLTDLALMSVSCYPGSGEQCTTLLRLRFMEEADRSDQQVAELLSMERSTYYDRKKEATLLFGISLWGFVLPTALTTYRRVSDMGMMESDFFDLIASNLSNRQIA